MTYSGFYSDTYQDVYGATFAPPTENSDGWLSYGTPESEQANLLWRHYGTRTVGVNVYILTDGTITFDDPDGTTITWSDVRTVIWGGHVPAAVSDADRAVLLEAGYTVVDG